MNAGTISHVVGGTITSSESFLEVRLLSQKRTDGYSYITVDSVITDSNHKVGLRITGNDTGEGGFTLGGSQSNTFTGNVEVSGGRNHLTLDKKNGAIAVRGDILVKDRALVRFSKSNQTLVSSNVTLKNYGVLQNLSNSTITNRLQSLIIEDHGIVQFNHAEGESGGAKYYIKLDELQIQSGGHLSVESWQEGRDFLLVRRDSSSLADALKKMNFVGYDPNNIHLEYFDEEYWSVSATPESTAYGAILGAVGLGFVAWKKRRQCPNKPPTNKVAAQ